jgi:phosphoglycolate phosphatase
MRFWICGVSGVLIDSSALTRAAFVATGARFGIRSIAERLRAVAGCALPAAYATLDPHVDVAACAAFHVAYVRERLGHVRSHVGVLETLREARRSEIGIMAAANNGELAEASLVRTGLYPLIDYLVTQEDPDSPERHPHVISRAVDLLRSGGDSCVTALYISDVPSEIAMGRAAGVLTVGTTYGQADASDIRAAQPHHVISTFAAMRRFLLSPNASDAICASTVSAATMPVDSRHV